MRKEAFAVLLCISATSCVYTSRHAPEYQHEYVLTEDRKAYHCEKFTGQWSLLFGGLRKVLCFRAAFFNAESAIQFYKGDRVKITKLYRIEAIDAEYNDARIRITQLSTGMEYTVYSDWPELLPALAEAR